MVLFSYILMCLIFGTTFLAIKIGIDAGAPPFFSAGIRFFLAGLILFLWMVWKKGASFSLLWRKEMVLTGFCLTFGVFATLYWAEQYVTSGIASVLSATAPLMILLLQSSLMRQRIPFPAMAGCLLGLVGVVLLLLPNDDVHISTYWIVGCVMILFGQLFYSSGAVYSKRVIERFHETSPIALNAAQMMHGGVMLLILSFSTEQLNIESVLSTNAFLSLLYLIIVGSMMGHTIFYWLVAKTNPVLPSTWLYVSPLIALSLGVIFYHEPLTLNSLLGGMTIILGIVLINVELLKSLIGFTRAKTREY